jgi:hypothetical protein
MRIRNKTVVMPAMIPRPSIGMLPERIFLVPSVSTRLLVNGTLVAGLDSPVTSLEM